MRKSRIFGKNTKKSNLIVESNKPNKNDDKSTKLQDKLLELEDFEIEALFEAGRITLEEYQYILDFRKKKKRKKDQKEQFEKRIRCNNDVILKVVNLGRRFRIEDLLSKGKFEEARRVDVNNEIISEIEEEQNYQIDERTRDKKKEDRLKQKSIDRSSKGRGRERDSR